MNHAAKVTLKHAAQVSEVIMLYLRLMQEEDKDLSGIKTRQGCGIV